MKSFFSTHSLPLSCLFLGLLGGCTDKMLAPLAVKPVDGYVQSEKPPTYAVAKLGAKPANRLHKASPSGLVLHRGDKVLIVKRMDPNWYVISRLGQEYFITYDDVSLSPN
jgi:hypothetical protein